MDITGTMNPMAAVACIVNPHMSKAMVAMLTSIMLQKPHFLLVKRPKAATNPKIPRERNIIKSTRDVVYEMGISKNCPIPAGVPTAAKQSLPMD